MKPPPKSIFARSLKLFGAGSRVLSNEFATYVKSSFNQSQLLKDIQNKARTEQIRILTQTFSQMKGSAMKFGQMLSLEAHDLLPPEAVQILSQLQNNADPVDSEILFSLARKEIGITKFATLELESKPIATASIGQVFKGHLQGKPIVVKIQYPGISETIDSDIEVLKSVMTVLGLFFGKKINLNELFKELNIVLKNEANYLKEAEHLKKYTEMLVGDERFVVPKVIDEYSSQKVLTMSFVEGTSLKEWMTAKHSQSEQIVMGKQILDLFCKEYFANGFVQTDPNLANFLVQEEGLKLVLLDFGAVLSYPPQFRALYRALLKLILEGESKKIIEFCVQHNFLDPRENSEAMAAFIKMLDLAIYPFKVQNQPFHFADQDYAGLIRNAVFSFSRLAKYSPPPKELIFLHRKLGGIFNMLKMMNLSLDLTSYRKQMIQD